MVEQRWGTEYNVFNAEGLDDSAMETKQNEWKSVRTTKMKECVIMYNCLDIENILELIKDVLRIKSGDNSKVLPRVDPITLFKEHGLKECQSCALSIIKSRG